MELPPLFPNFSQTYVRSSFFYYWFYRGCRNERSKNGSLRFFALQSLPSGIKFKKNILNNRDFVKFSKNKKLPKFHNFFTKLLKNFILLMFHNVEWGIVLKYIHRPYSQNCIVCDFFMNSSSRIKRSRFAKNRIRTDYSSFDL